MTALALLANLTLSPRLTKSTSLLEHCAYLTTLFEWPASEAAKSRFIRQFQQSIQKYLKVLLASLNVKSRSKHFHRHYLHLRKFLNNGFMAFWYKLCPCALSNNIDDVFFTLCYTIFVFYIAELFSFKSLTSAFIH